MTGKVFACVIAVTGAAMLTLATMITLVQGSILAASIALAMSTLVPAQVVIANWFEERLRGTAFGVR